MEVPLGNWGVGKEIEVLLWKNSGSLRRWKRGSGRRGFSEAKEEISRSVGNERLLEVGGSFATWGFQVL